MSLLNGEEIEGKLLWPKNQNQLVDLFKRLIDNGKIDHNLTDCKNWICKNFLQNDGKEFSKESVYDILRGKSPCTKSRRILTDLDFS